MEAKVNLLKTFATVVLCSGRHN